MENIGKVIREYFTWIALPNIKVSDVLEILILAVLIYQVTKWVKNTRAWTLVKGIIFLMGFCVLAVVLDLDVILWIIQNTVSVGIIAVIILFQPELRKALEELGKKKIVSSILNFDEKNENLRYSDETIEELVRATFEMAKTKTGALIVLERDIRLEEYERTGIPLDARVSSQLLVNIFEHNTPLHDGAIIIRDDRIVAATCYLPLSDNMGLSKDLGTRHRAGVGISEVTDCLTIIVSEETGKVSLVSEGALSRGLDAEQLRKQLREAQMIGGQNTESRKKLKLWRGRVDHEK